MAHSGRPERQPEPSATRDCRWWHRPREPFPSDTSSPGVVFRVEGFCCSLGIGLGLFSSLSLLFLGCIHKQQSCVCQSLRFTAQKQQQEELAPSRRHTPLSVQTHCKKAGRGAMSHHCGGVECPPVFHPTKTKILATIDCQWEV